MGDVVSFVRRVLCYVVFVCVVPFRVCVVLFALLLTLFFFFFFTQNDIRRTCLPGTYIRYSYVYALNV